MLDGVSLDHLRIFVAAVETGSFSAAGRRVGRAQSVVSQAIAGLEAQLGVTLFTRAARLPALTPEGQALAGRARDIVRAADTLKAEARSMAAGLEPELSVVVDVMFPMAALTDAIGAFALAFPGTTLQLQVEALGAAAQWVLDGRCRVGVMGSLPVIPPEFEQVPLMGVPMVTVAAPGSPLAQQPGRLTRQQLKGHVQLVLTDRSPLTAGRDFGVLGDTVWRLADIGAKHAFLRAGLGWGHMPRPMVEDDLRDGRLVRIQVETGVQGDPMLEMKAVYRRDALPGPAGRWLIERLRQYPDCGEARAAPAA
ncbi:LysR family transcriptional regulator [Acidovorax sp. BLS4]|uniref:LysR family transcriptional regulator n=1 Tax=Acidovorax sp. BLS4 TaxID=3273430 RepID=UPI0029436766|nr:LysR family transcriptional regulator [Paracidovorax avenae]WOI47039.1 LysR family transcriptional regulator [Paracidovorax avenae]